VRSVPAAAGVDWMEGSRSASARLASVICEAVMRPTMRFVPVKSVEQQSAAMLHCSRALVVKQRTMLLHSIRAHLAELGISTGAGISQMTRVVRELEQGGRIDLPELARFVLETLARLVCDLTRRLHTIEKKLVSWHYRKDLSNRLETIPVSALSRPRRSLRSFLTRRLSDQVGISLPGWQDAPRSHQQARKSIHPATAHPRCNIGAAIRSPARRRVELGWRSAAASAAEGCRRCSCQQDGPHRMLIMRRGGEYEENNELRAVQHTSS
jgi:transposase